MDFFFKYLAKKRWINVNLLTDLDMNRLQKLKISIERADKFIFPRNDYEIQVKKKKKTCPTLDNQL